MRSRTAGPHYRCNSRCRFTNRVRPRSSRRRPKPGIGRLLQTSRREGQSWPINNEYRRNHMSQSHRRVCNRFHRLDLSLTTRLRQAKNHIRTATRKGASWDETHLDLCELGRRLTLTVRLLNRDRLIRRGSEQKCTYDLPRGRSVHSSKSGMQKSPAVTQSRHTTPPCRTRNDSNRCVRSALPWRRGHLRPILLGRSDDRRRHSSRKNGLGHLMPARINARIQTGHPNGRPRKSRRHA